MVISFEHLQKLYWFWKFGGFGLKIRPAMHALFNFEFEMGMAGTILKPHPCNLEILCIFDRSSNDVIIIFWYS